MTNFFVKNSSNFDPWYKKGYFEQEWNSMFLTFSHMIEGTSKRVMQFLMPLETICNKNFCLNEQKCLLLILP
jgi:hypothetical protein